MGGCVGVRGRRIHIKYIYVYIYFYMHAFNTAQETAS